MGGVLSRAGPSASASRLAIRQRRRACAAAVVLQDACRGIFLVIMGFLREQ
jgi:hypothetical protein